MGIRRQAKAAQNGVEENALPIVGGERGRPAVMQCSTKRLIPVDGRAVAQCRQPVAAKTALEVDQAGQASRGIDEDVVFASVRRADHQFQGRADRRTSQEEIEVSNLVIKPEVQFRMTPPARKT